MPQNFNELGLTGLRRYGGWVDEELLRALSGPAAIRIYREMSDNDPTVGAMLFASEQLIRSASWTVKPASDKPVDKEAAEFLQSCMDDMSHTWMEFIVESLSMLIYGWSWHEIVYKKRAGNQKNPKFNSKYNDGRIGWRKLPGRSQDSLYQWLFDEDDGDILAMIQQPPPDFRNRTIPLTKSLLFRTRANKNNPEGRSLLRNAYRPWYFKKRIEEIEGIGVERDLAGLPVLTPPEELDLWNDNDPIAVIAKNAAERLVRNIRRDENEGVVLPFGWTLELLSTGSKRQFDTNDIINRYDQRIAVTILADVVLLGAEKVGSYALAEVKKSLYASGLESILDSIAAVFNQYAIPRLFDLNIFPGIKDLPILVHGEIETPDLDQLSRFITAMHNTGSPIATHRATENHLREVAGIPLLEESFVIEDPKEEGKESPDPNTAIDNLLSSANNKNNPKQTNDGSEEG